MGKLDKFLQIYCTVMFVFFCTLFGLVVLAGIVVAAVQLVDFKLI